MQDFLFRLKAVISLEKHCCPNINNKSKYMKIKLRRGAQCPYLLVSEKKID
nr:MAG TPA: hypothetical protein [Caudoviricetes sp.]